MPAEYMYDVGCRNSTSCPCMPNGRSVAPPDVPPGRSAVVFATVTIGWNGGVAPRQAGSARTAVEELESSVLIVRSPRNRIHVDLIEVVLARVLDGHARLE